MFREGDWILIRYGEKRYLRRLDPADSLNVRKDVLRFRDVVGKPEGVRIGRFEVFRPTLEEMVLLGFTRRTQIIYPKDAFFIALKLGLGKDSRVLEFGTGSGALCAVLASVAGEVWTYEEVEEFHRTAKENLSRFGLGKNVRFYLGDFLRADVPEGFFDAVFVDVKDPVPYLEKVHSVLKDGSPAGFLLPTANQVSDLLKSLGDLFGGVEVLEILVRYYKTVPERFRPEDTMVGHTAYLVFCRKIRS
ncbi:MAG: tRNA (adenine-N1)-methyltransferase [Aquificota bacterium]|nr:tRNA (adenine-N1)-methyltransferase [Aquificota bacterium]